MKFILMAFFLVICAGGLLAAIQYVASPAPKSAHITLAGIAAFISGFFGLLSSAVFL